MARIDDLSSLPEHLPAPHDDGACDHLSGLALPSLELPSTSGDPVNLSALTGVTIVYCYPRTGDPDRDPPTGWNDIPGARGCTPQSCAFRDHHAQLTSLGARVHGLSSQSLEQQREAAQRLALPYSLLSDHELSLADAIDLPTFTVEGARLVKRLTLVIRDGRIEHVMYPVFPPDRNAVDVAMLLASSS